MKHKELDAIPSNWSPISASLISLLMPSTTSILKSPTTRTNIYIYFLGVCLGCFLASLTIPCYYIMANTIFYVLITLENNDKETTINNMHVLHVHLNHYVAYLKVVQNFLLKHNILREENLCMFGGVLIIACIILVT
jgi:hypothetical protein